MLWALARGFDLAEPTERRLKPKSPLSHLDQKAPISSELLEHMLLELLGQCLVTRHRT